MKLFNSSKKRMLGQGMTEYIIIVALIAIAAIGVFGMFGDVVKNQVAAMAKELSGTDGQVASDKARTRSNDAVKKAEKNAALNDFTGQTK